MTLAHTLVEYAVPAALITMLPGPDTAMILTTAVKAATRDGFGQPPCVVPARSRPHQRAS